MATHVESGPPAAARPTGSVTFLFSDIEGSTSRWESATDAMEIALARHDLLVRNAIEAHGGYVFKTIGDSFCAAFATAFDATAAALDAQRALASEDFSAVQGIRVRVALHTGPCFERDGDYFGPTVNRVARLLAIGHGGQVLISGASADVLRHEIPAKTSLRDLGEHRLKDLAHAERVYQLVAPDLPESFPALLSLNYLSNNLPAQSTSFVGREGVLADVKALLKDHRLVTLVGTGGAGKTRCAIQVGAELVDGTGSGVWLAELAPISDDSLVASVVARALGVRESPSRPILDTLLEYLKRKRLLIILDNCEHVIDQVAVVAAAILRDCSDVRILATSREPLNNSGEHTYRMPSLTVPSNAESLFEEGTSQYGAVQLFVDRAVSSDRRFALTEQNASYVAEICRRLDGIPLAIELAAARIKVLSPQQLVQKLDERFRVLTGGDRTALPRHQTMRALIDWSYDLLSKDERALFRRLSIFAGGFTLETAPAVCSEAAMDEIAVLDLVSSLVDKSLVQADAVGDGTRYRMLESTRQYAREKLAEAGEEEAVARAHARALFRLAEQLGDVSGTTPDRVWQAQAELELENFRAALSWAFGVRGDVLLGQRIAGTLRRVWSNLVTVEGRRWVQAALRCVTEDTPVSVLAGLDLAESLLAAALNQHKVSLRAGERALTRYRELADPLGIAEAELRIGRAQLLLGDIADGEALMERSLEAARALGARVFVISALESLAVARQIAGDLPGARARHREALATAQDVGADRFAATIAMNLAEMEFGGGNATGALRLANESLAVYRVFADTTNLALLRSNMAAYCVSLRLYDEARAAGREAITRARDTQWSVVLAFAPQHLAAIATLRSSDDSTAIEDLERAARILGYVDARLAALEAVREHTEQQEYDVMVPTLRDAFGEEKLSKLMAEGSTWSEDQAIAEAMLI